MSVVAVVAIWVTYLTGWTVLRQSLTRLPRPRWGAVLLWCVVAVPSLVQLLWAPELLEWGGRDASAIASGEWWRLATSIVLQDGGWFGTVFNLSMLAVTLLLIGDVCRGLTCVSVFLVGGVLANVLTLWTTGQSGAGNSMATMCLLAAMAVTVAWPRRPAREVLVPCALLVVATLSLVVTGDEHGPAVVLGLVMGAGLVRRGLPVDG
ncbi:rhomboid family intramembrane serine protease [Ornithinimicrobium faecis]|uniref:Rhomboid family intramembrane serine protease n=1 Tax=Ornithinimicrobium faecis TaxID=2934158 RepID=A0ABY4YR57_9MICO|nr:rhomboid family intramembrane serine protease [Ornithinimicrobium sp. HY1793]USQ79241.1 rhomboid family intramembrane serine protease [Ornithinimicrobium sp. HY1793]